jgi:SNF2 family DNA or RNA helicase
MHMIGGLIENKPRRGINGPVASLSEEMHKRVKEMLLEGPNIIIADEAHYLKNAQAQISQACRSFRSMSRIAMTGSPLSNNLIEYWTMIDWIDPGFLGPQKEFQSRFVIPIQDGLYADSDYHEKRMSLKMLNVLKNDIGPKVHRADISVIEKDLPQKTEFLVKVPLTPLQCKM